MPPPRPSCRSTIRCSATASSRTAPRSRKHKYVRAIATGEAIGAYALTEPQSGSDASAMHTRATKNDDGDWVINGKKSWITSGPVARYIVLFAITTPGHRRQGRVAPSSSIPRCRASMPARPSRSWASAPRPPARSSSTTTSARRKTCWARSARASRSPWACSTPAASASPRRRWALPVPPTRPRWTGRASARRSAIRSAPSR